MRSLFKKKLEKTSFDDPGFAKVYFESTRNDLIHEEFERSNLLKMAGNLSQANVLVLGAGPGAYASHLIEKCERLVCVDKSEEMNRIARAEVPEAEIHTADIVLEIPVTDGSFDIVISPLTFQYIEDWTALFGRIRKFLKPRGRLLFSVTNPIITPDSTDYYRTEQYNIDFSEFGKTITAFRRPLSDYFNPLLSNGFEIKEVKEPRPGSEIKTRAPELYARLNSSPLFVFFDCTLKD